MKVFIEDMERTLFLTSTGKWTPFKELAHNFQSTIMAWDTCLRRAERRLGIYVAFSDPRLDFRLDVNRFKPSLSPEIPETAGAGNHAC